MITRRQFIRNTGLGLSASIVQNLPVSADSDNNSSMLVFYDENVVPRIFIEYLHQQFASEAITDLTNWNVDDILQLNDILHRYSGYQAIGFVGNDLYPLLEQCARDAGASIVCHARHVVDRSGSRHVYYTTPESQGISSVFDNFKPNTNLSVSENCPGSRQCSADSTFNNQDCSEWWQLVAQSLYQLASGRWQACTSKNIEQTGELPSNDTYSVESFAIRL